MATRSGNSFRLGRPRKNPLPSEPYVYHALAEGRSVDAIAASIGIGRKTLENFIATRRDRWAVSPPGKLTADERRIVITREAYCANGYRVLTISLPRISMHVAAREEARRNG